MAEKRDARNVGNLPRLTEPMILQWADEHHERTGAWPTVKSGKIPASGGEKWLAIDVALRNGARGLPGGFSLAKLLAKHRGVRNRKQLPHLTEESILSWADAFYERTGRWPMTGDGPIADAPGETWAAVNLALSHGQRGMPGGSSLAFLLASKRGAHNDWTRSNLTEKQILAWADAFRQATGKWPIAESGPIAGTVGDTWCAVDQALKKGHRSLSGRSSLAKLLAAERGVRNVTSVPPLNRRKITAWAKAHFRGTGKWPTRYSGAIEGVRGETWAAIDAALQRGLRGIRGSTSLARFLMRTCGKRHHLLLPPLSKKKILAWADAHFQKTGKWPSMNSGAVSDAPDETWKRIDNALRLGQRGLPGGSSLPALLAKKRGKPLQPPQWQALGSWPRAVA